MESPLHPLGALFRQLGLPGDAAAVAGFVIQHAPLPGDVRLADAPFWTPAQAQFLCEAVRDDADWAAIVEQLDVLLRAAPGG